MGNSNRTEEVFGLRHHRCTIRTVEVQKFLRFCSNLPSQLTSGCHTEGPFAQSKGDFSGNVFFRGGYPPPGALVLYIMGERKTVVPTEKTATNNKVFGLRQFRCTIHAVRVRKVPRFWSDFEEQATSGCHTEGPLCSVHGRFFQDRGGVPISSFFHVPGSAKKTGEVRQRLDNFWT